MELDQYRLYVDESGDHTFKDTERSDRRFLCILGCWFRTEDYCSFHVALESFKQRHIPHNPDDPVVLHREDILNRRKAFWRLRDPAFAERFDDDLIGLVRQAKFGLCGVVIDKAALKDKYIRPFHPYHLALGFLLQRYCKFLNRLGGRGDVMAEARGGTEDRELKAAYQNAYERGYLGYLTPSEVQSALTSKEVKLKPKLANIAGLQLADLLAHPVRKVVPVENGLSAGPLSPFEQRVLAAIDSKFHCHPSSGRADGYGKVLFPRPAPELAGLTK
jgi:hypothetical protein